MFIVYYCDKCVDGDSYFPHPQNDKTY